MSGDLNLDEEEKKVWRRLAIFPASFSIEAADTIARLQPADDFNPADVLDSLVEKSVVTAESQRDEVRYRLLESLRLYALGKLFENKELEQSGARTPSIHIATRSKLGMPGLKRPPLPGGPSTAISSLTCAPHWNVRLGWAAILSLA